MKASFLLQKATSRTPKANIFANGSSLVIYELLLTFEREFSIQGIARTASVSAGLAHRVVSELVHIGLVKVRGVRTAKKYQLIKPARLCRLWMEFYNITEKCRFHTYDTGYSSKELAEHILSSRLSSAVIFALHAACSRMGYSFTNLNTTELYLLQPESRGKIERLLRLEPRERGYQVLLIEPYYSKVLKWHSEKLDGLMSASSLLTFLDLYHFPLRGREQAEHLLHNHPSLAKLSSEIDREKIYERRIAR